MSLSLDTGAAEAPPRECLHSWGLTAAWKQSWPLTKAPKSHGGFAVPLISPCPGATSPLAVARAEHHPRAQNARQAWSGVYPCREQREVCWSHQMAGLACKICDSSGLWSGWGGVRPGARLGDWFGSPHPPFGAGTSSRVCCQVKAGLSFWTHEALIHWGNLGLGSLAELV